jgi:hypothetical protein
MASEVPGARAGRPAAATVGGMTVDTTPEEAERAAAGWLAAAQQVTVLTGAGISTESGIPDFRGPQGVWTKDPAAQALFTIDN